MAKIADLPRTSRDVIAALLFEEIDALCEKVNGLNTTLKGTEETLKSCINQLEGAGERYNQAVLAANLRSKNEMFEYLKTVSASTVVKTHDEQREIVQKLIREAVSKEITALKKALSESNAHHQVPFLSSWGRIIICCSLTALMGSAITVELIQRLGIS